MRNSHSRSEEFLRIYRMVESALEKRYGNGTHSGSVVFDYIRENPDSEPVRHELNVCREIRNILSHNADSAGEPVVEPSAAILDALQSILKHVTAPPLAAAYGTPREQILCADPDALVLQIMHEMNRRGFSHVPILEDERMVGVFSIGSLFHHLEQKGPGALREDTRMRQLQDSLGFDAHGSEKYLFVPENTTIIQARSAFEKRSAPNYRLSAIFITRNGCSDEPLLAMLTPWDALKDTASTAKQEDAT